MFFVCEYLYHGFPEPVLESILSHGILRNRASAYKDKSMAGKMGFVYLTDCLAPKYAFDTRRSANEALKNLGMPTSSCFYIARTRLQSLDSSSLFPDDFWLSDLIKKPIAEITEEDLSLYQDQWQVSLDTSGKVAYKLNIPRSELELFQADVTEMPDPVYEAAIAVESDAFRLCNYQRFVGQQVTLALSGESFCLTTSALSCGRDCAVEHDLSKLQSTLQSPLDCVRRHD